MTRTGKNLLKNSFARLVVYSGIACCRTDGAVRGGATISAAAVLLRCDLGLPGHLRQ